MTEAPWRSPLLERLPSDVPGIHWPPIPGARHAAVLGLLFQMEHSQWLPRDVLRAQQKRQLQALLTHARRHCRFYRERLPEEPTGWAAIPQLRRQDLQTNFADLLADAYPRAHGKTFDISTGGSTAEPVTVRRSALTQLFWQAATLRDHLWHRRDFSTTIAIIRQFSSSVKSTRAGQWGGVFRSGAAWHLPISTDIATQIRWLQKTVSATEFLSRDAYSNISNHSCCDSCSFTDEVPLSNSQVIAVRSNIQERAFERVRGNILLSAAATSLVPGGQWPIAFSDDSLALKRFRSPSQRCEISLSEEDDRTTYVSSGNDQLVFLKIGERA